MAESRAAAGWVVYLLRCRGDRLYCGITNDLPERWRAHHEGRGARFTRAFPPEELLGAVDVGQRGTALRIEAAIKRLPRDRKWAALQQAGAKI